MTVQESRAGAGGQIGIDLLVTSGASAVPCDVTSLAVSVSASLNGEAGPFTPIHDSNIVVQCASGAADVAVVVDNSGSEHGKLDALKAGAGQLIERVVSTGGRASLVRVSTNSSIKAPLTSDGPALAAAVDALFIRRGWTSLWDGIRMGNETLGGDLEPVPASVGDIRQFCGASRKLAIVAFTDGHDNNSADENADSYDYADYPGDGLATTLDDLLKLRVDHITTPIYTIGLGHDIDEVGLAALANASGGRYRRLTDPAMIEEAFADISDYFGSTHQICADLPWSACGDVTLQTDWTWTGAGGATLSGINQSTVHVPCEAARGSGRSAAIVLTMSNPGIDRATARRLAANAVDWVAPRSTPAVLVVLDDGHHNEFVGDAAYVRDLLGESGYAATLADEPANGLRPSDVAGYDVVWFTNPGYPWNDVRSVDTLEGFLANGGGVVVQGDDITQSMGNSFSVSSLTHLKFQHNGTSTCDVQTDNNEGASLQVDLGAGHPLLEGIEHARFFYGDDVDQSVPVGTAAQVLGHATFARGACTASRPVLTAFDPGL